jgi:hypothetical protein
MAINQLGEQYASKATRVAINTATTTVVSATGTRGVATLRVVGGTLGAVTVYNNGAASGTVIIPTVTPLSGAVLMENVPFDNGLTVVTASAMVVVGTVSVASNNSTS